MGSGPTNLPVNSNSYARPPFAWSKLLCFDPYKIKVATEMCPGLVKPKIR